MPNTRKVENDKWPPICKRHKPFAGGMLAWYGWIEKKEKKGAKQKQCPKCKRYFFKEEY